jgi:hypothetical protein
VSIMSELETIYTTNRGRLVVKHEIHKCKLPESCPDFGKHLIQLEIGDHIACLVGSDITDLVSAINAAISKDV